MFKKLLFLSLAMLLGFAMDAAHFRAGFISWQVDANDPSGRTIIFKISQSYGGWALGSSYVNPNNIGQPTGRTWDSFRFGDGQSQSFDLTLTAFNQSEGYWFGETTISHTYASTGNFTASFGSCCRIAALANNANRSWTNSTLVNVGSGNNSPVATLPAVINVQQGLSAASFQLPATDPDGDALSYRLANAGEAGSGNANPSGLSVNASTGVVSFNTVGKAIGTLYSAAFVVSDGSTSVLLDVIMKVVQQSNAPQFDYTYTPQNNFSYQVGPGQNVNFNVRAFDNDASSTVTLQGVGIPPGATMNPGLPVSAPSGSNTQFVQSSFNWTPTASNLGSNVITFIAQDEFGVQTATSVSIVVSLAPVFDVPPTPSQTAHNVYVPGSNISFTVQASDPDPVDVVQIVSANGKNHMGAQIPLYAGANFATPTASGNPTSGTFTWNTVAADWGHKHVFFTAEDSYGDQTVHEVPILINTDPIFTSTPVTSGQVGQLYTYTITGSDPDVAFGDALTILAPQGLPSWLTLIDNGDGTATLSGTPSVTDAGNHTVSINLEDINHHHNTGGIPNQTFTITVNACTVTLGAAAQNETCPSAADGSVILTPSNGIAPFTFGKEIFNETLAPFSASDFTSVNFNVSQASNEVRLTPSSNSNWSDQFVSTNSFAKKEGLVLRGKVYIPVAGYKAVMVGFHDGVNNTTSAILNGLYFFDNGSGSTVSIRTSNNATALSGATGLPGNKWYEYRITIQNGGAQYELREEGASAYTYSQFFADNQTNANLHFGIQGNYNPTNPTNSGTWHKEVVINDGQPTSNLTAGNYTFYVQDDAGCQDSVEVTIGTDGDEPQFTVCPGTVTANVDAGSCGANVSFLTTASGTGVIGTYELTGATVGSGAGDGSGLFYNVGTTNVRVFATNSCGVDTCDLQVVVTDNEAPSVATNNVTVQLDANGNGTIATTIPAVTIFSENWSTQTPALYSAPASINQFTINSGSVDLSNFITSVAGNEIDLAGNSNAVITSSAINLAPGDYTFSFSHLLNSNPQGSNSVQVQIGSFVNQTYASTSSVQQESVSFTVNNPTSVNIVFTQLGPNDAAGSFIGGITIEEDARQGFTIEGAISDACGISSITVSQQDFTCADLGANTVTLTATDVNGNTNQATATVTVEDNILPTMATNSISVDLTSRTPQVLTQAEIDQLGANSSDNCSVTYSISSHSFDCNTVGQTVTLTLTGTDAAGNLANVPVQVTVTDLNSVCNDPPVAACAPFTVSTDGNCQAFITAADVDGGSSDPDGDALTYSLDNTGPFGVGTHTVTLTVSDGEYSDNCTAIVTVEDNTNPTALTQDITVQLDASGNAGITAGDIDNGSNDACGIATMSVSPSTFNCSNVGANTVTLTVTDVNGNVSHETAVVTVEDNVNPNILVQNITVPLDANGIASFSAQMVDVGTTDNCGIDSIWITGDSLECGDVGDNIVVFYAQDVNGNVEAANFTVTVEDNSLPTVLTQNLIVELDENGQASVSVGGSGASPTTLFWAASAGDQIWSAAIDGSGTPSIVYSDATPSGTRGAAAVEYDIATDQLFWTSGNIWEIWQGNADGSATQAKLTNGSGSLAGGNDDRLGISLDIPNNRYYFSIAFGGGLWYANADNSGSATQFFDPGNAWISALDYDVQNGWVYYNQYGGSGSPDGIWRVRNDGTGNMLVHASSDPRGMVVDAANNKVYWVEKGTKTIKEGNADGTGVPATLYSTSLTNARDIDFDPSTGDLYWTEFSSGSASSTDNIVRGNIDGSASTIVYSGNYGSIKGLSVGAGLGSGGNGVDAGSFDNCGIASLSLDTTDFNCSDVGANTVTLTATDVNGNVSSGTATVTVEDNLDPVMMTQDITVQLDASGNASITEGDIDNGTFDNCAFALSLDLTSFDCSNVGANTVTLTATDVNGNVSNETAVVTVEDNVNPTALTQNITVQLDAAGNASITAGDIDNGSNDACGIASTTIDVASFNCSNVGANTVTLTVTDNNGNVSMETAVVTVEDNVNPIALTQDITVQLDASGNASIVAADIDNGSSDACGIATLNVSPSTFSCSNVGANTVTLTVTDVNGNVSAETAVVTVEDSIAPTIVSCLQNDTLTNTPLNCLQLYSWVDPMVTDNCDPSGITFAYSAPGINILNFHGAYLANFPVGTTTVQVTATDVNGNASQCSFDVTVLDTEAPTFTGCPASDIVVNTDADVCEAVVNWQPILASDNCPGVGLVQSHFSGSTFSLGTTVVTYTATDAKGNTSTCSFNVVVEDNQAPNAIAQDITVQLDASGNTSIVAADIDNGSNDACGVASVSVSPSTFNCANVGANTVTLTVTDNNGNVSTTTATVTVEDNIAPSAVAQDITVQLDASGNASIVAADVDNGSADNCGVASLSVSPSTFNCANVGANTVTLTVTDVNGNVSTTTATVTVEDNVAPSAVAQDITVQLDASGNASIVAADVDNGSADNCGVASLSVSPSTFNCANVGANTVTLTVTDVNGNVSTTTATVTVEDNIAPSAVAQNITIQLDALGLAAIKASDIDNGSSDNCGIASTVVAPGFFTCGEVGANTVTLTVTDVNGNVSTTTATVTVEDNIAPSAVAQDITVQLDGSGNASIVAADVDNGSSDNCGIATLNVTPSSFTCADVPAGNVSIATDASWTMSTFVDTVSSMCFPWPGAMSIPATSTFTQSVSLGQPYAWQTIAPVGNSAVINTDSDVTFFRKTFDLSTTQNLNAVIETSFDDDMQIFINGQLVAMEVDFNASSYTGVPHQVSLGSTGVNTNGANGGDQFDTVTTAALSSILQVGTNEVLIALRNSFNPADRGGFTMVMDITSNAAGTPVVLTITDVNGNVSTANANVLVQDNVAPSAVAQDITVQLDASGNASIVAADVDNGSADNCGVASLSVAPSTFNCANVGANTVTLTVTDVNGNVSTTTATVTVEDNVAPSAVAQDITVQLDASGNTSIVAADIDNGSNDACGVASVSVSPSTFNCANVGANTVTLTVTDNNGNVSTTTATVTVEDNIAPSAVAQDITVQLDASGNASIVAADVDNGSADNCGVASLSVSPSTFNCSNVGANTVTLTVTDVNGNVSTTTATVTVEDNIAPSAVAQDITVQLDASGNVSIVAADVDNGSSDACGVASTTIDVSSFDCSNVGPNTVTLTVTDVNGNVSTTTATVTVEDNIAPSAVAQDITVQLDASGNASIVAADVDNGSADNCGVASLSVAPSTFNCANVGANTVTLTVTDVNGNVSTTTATVTVEDNVAPVAMAQNITISLDQNDMASISAGDIDNGSADNCGIASMSVTPSSFGCNEIGANTVALTVLDVNGNASVVTATVTVEAGNFLEIAQQADINASCDFSSNGNSVSWDEPSVKAFSSCSPDTCPVSNNIAGFDYLGEFNGHRYFRSTSRKYNWHEANDAANAAGGHLASINSSAENHWIACRVQGPRAWIGLNDLANEGSFEWTSGDAFTYNKWKRNEPNNKGGKKYAGNSTGDYVTIDRNSGNWRDWRGGNDWGFIMEVPCGNSVEIQQIAGPSSGSVFASNSSTQVTYVAVDTLTGVTDTMSFTVTVDECVPNYCSATGHNTNYEWIQSVSLANVSNNSGNDNGYGDYTNLTADLVAGQQASLSLTPGFANNSYKEYWTVFIDWNRDGDFYDQGECVYVGKGYGTKNKTFTVPTWAASGDLRMRVMMSWCAYTYSCSNISYGEVEDYTINVSGQAMHKTEVGITAMEIPAEAGNQVQFAGLYPNPVNGGNQLNVYIRSLEERTSDISVMDVTGRLIYTEKTQLAEGMTTVRMSTNKLAQGVYFVKIDGHNETLKFIVNK